MKFQAFTVDESHHLLMWPKLSLRVKPFAKALVKTSMLYMHVLH